MTLQITLPTQKKTEYVSLLDQIQFFRCPKKGSSIFEKNTFVDEVGGGSREKKVWFFYIVWINEDFLRGGLFTDYVYGR